MGRLLPVWLTVACLSLLAGSVAGADDPSEPPPGVPFYHSEGFNGPLVGEYRLIQTAWVSELADDPPFGTYHIRSKYRGVVVKNVAMMAVNGNYVVGREPDAYFVIDSTIDTSVDGPAVRDAVRRFPDAATWQAALGAVGVPPAIALETPDVVASRVPRTVGFASQYTRPHNLGGMSDPDWAGNGLMVVLLAMVALGGIGDDRVKLLVPSLAAGLIGAIWWEFLIPGDLGGPCASLLTFPVFCLVAGWFGKVAARAVRSVVRRRAKGAPPNREPSGRPSPS
ncbi:MAG: hypothetical protein JWO31_4068 [Phycisphaerales bacterium]|nr:hypothetical protein [Phycisphaerales bacterium]